MKKGVSQMERCVRPDVNKETACSGHQTEQAKGRRKSGKDRCFHVPGTEGRMSVTRTVGVAGEAKCVSTVQRSGGRSAFIHSLIPQTLMSASCMRPMGVRAPQSAPSSEVNRYISRKARSSGHKGSHEGVEEGSSASLGSQGCFLGEKMSELS